MSNPRNFVRLWFTTVLLVGMTIQKSHRSEAGEGVPEPILGPVRSVGVEGERYGEPWIAANPRDASQLIILTSRIVGSAANPVGREIRPSAWATDDGGMTWSAGTIVDSVEMSKGMAHFADAHATFAPDGIAFAVFCGSVNGDRLDLRIYRSDDAGKHWIDPTPIVGNLDYPRLAADMQGGKSRVFLAVAGDGRQAVMGTRKREGYGCLILRSIDSARSFSLVNFLAPTTLSQDPINSPLILPDGSLLVGFQDYPNSASETALRDQFLRTRSYSATSRDGGSNFTTPAPIRDHTSRVGFLTLAADTSAGPRRGRIYGISYSRADGPSGLRIQSSTDAANWTSPTPIASMPNGPTPLAAAAVSSRGALGIFWIQAVPGKEFRVGDDAWLAREHDFEWLFMASTDGGTTFSKPIRLGQSRTDKEYPRWCLGGDYLTLAASPDGSFHAAWIDTQDAKGALRTVRIDIRP